MENGAAQGKSDGQKHTWSFPIQDRVTLRWHTPISKVWDSFE